MEIAMMGHKRVPSHEGGIEIVVDELGSRLAAMGNDVVCYNRSGHHVSGEKYDLKKVKEYKGMSIKYVPTIDKKGLAAMTSSFFAAFACAFGKYDIVHIHAEGPAFFTWIPKLFGKKVVVTVHGLDWKRAKWQNGLGSKYIHLGEKIAAKYADAIIVLSTTVQDYFIAAYGKETVYIPNGVNPGMIVDAKTITERFGLTRAGYILYVGRIVPEKGVKELVEAFNDLNTSKKLAIVGGHSDSKEYVAEVMEIASDNQNIVFTGFLEDQQLLAELYSNAYFYVLPSTLEGMPLTILEAMSYGNAVLTSEIYECASVIGKHGTTFEPGNVADLKEKMQILCDSPEIVEELKTGAVDYIKECFSWDDTAKRTLNVYKGVLGL